VENPGPAHWQAVKRVMRYLQGTRDAAITFHRDAQPELLCYVDADWAGDVDSRRSTTGYAFLLNGGPVCWESRRQKSVAMSSCEAEFIAAANAAKTNAWLRHLLGELRVSSNEIPTLFMEDNQGCIALVKNPIMGRSSKHIELRYHFVRDEYLKGNLEMQYCSTREQLADILTKSVDRTTFMKMRDGLGIEMRSRQLTEFANVARAESKLTEWECWKYLSLEDFESESAAMAEAIRAASGSIELNQLESFNLKCGVHLDISQGDIMVEKVELNERGEYIREADADSIEDAAWMEVQVERRTGPKVRSMWSLPAIAPGKPSRLKTSKRLRGSESGKMSAKASSYEAWERS
jgi:hypothetical protein